MHGENLKITYIVCLTWCCNYCIQ